MTFVRKFSVENYKSIRKLNLELGTVNVLIGANGSGKSNILEAIALGSAGARNKLDHEYVVPRGVRIVEPRFMRSAFPGGEKEGSIVVSFHQDGGPPQRIEIEIEPTGRMVIPPAVRFSVQTEMPISEQAESPISLKPEEIASLLGQVKKHITGPLFEVNTPPAPRPPIFPPDFLIYAPENSALRVFQAEPQVLPLGIKGEGLFAHLKALGTPKRADRLAAIGDGLALLDWFERFEIPKDLAPSERSLLIRDRYLAEGNLFDQRSANEGFLFLLFYLTLFHSDATPRFFAIDNVDASLNPKLVTTLIEQLVDLAKMHHRQVIFTTHNPAVLDGIDLNDDEQRIFVTERGKDGATRIRRVNAPKPLDGDSPVPLSEAFVRGYLGGLPKNF